MSGGFGGFGNILQANHEAEQFRRANRSELNIKTNKEAILRSALERIMSPTGPYADLIQLYSVQNPLDIQRGFDKAQAALNQESLAARTSVFDREKQLKARSEQSLISRGLSNTSVRETERRGIGNQTQSALSAIDNQFASRLSQLQVGRSQALTENFDGITSAFMARENAIQSNEAGQLDAVNQYEKKFNLDGHLWGGFADEFSSSYLNALTNGITTFGE